MTGVILRCPNCGTAQPSGGECEACREEQVRYFCTNHSPGFWLDSSSCALCGARFGDAVSATKAPPASPAPSEYRPSRRSEPAPDLRRSDPEVDPWAPGPSERDGPGRDHSGRPDASALILALLNAATRGRRRSVRGYDDAGSAPPRRRGGGCLLRLLMLALLLFALFLMVPIFLGALLGYG
jgi:hypothetical protein